MIIRPFYASFAPQKASPPQVDCQKIRSENGKNTKRDIFFKVGHAVVVVVMKCNRF